MVMPSEKRRYSRKFAARWLGCDEASLKTAMRLGWLTPVNGTKAGPRARFTIQQLKIFAWDWVYSLTMYDILTIRMHQSRGTNAKALAAYRGIPWRVVKLVQESEVCGLITELVRRHGRLRINRAGLEEFDKIPFKANLHSLGKNLQAVISNASRGKQYDSKVRAERRHWDAAVLPLRMNKIRFSELYHRNRCIKPRGVSDQEAAERVLGCSMEQALQGQPLETSTPEELERLEVLGKLLRKARRKSQA